MTKEATCSIDSCEKPADKCGMCSMHYQRWRKYGDPHKTVKTPNGEAIKFFEQIVMNHDVNECLIWPFARNRAGYAWLGKGLATRALCERVYGRPPSPRHEAAHTCGNGSGGCIAKNHLVWKTRTENEEDKLAHGTSNRGQRSAHAKLTDDDARYIKSHIGVMSQRELARRFGVSQTTIWEIKVGKRWAWLNQEAA